MDLFMQILGATLMVIGFVLLFTVVGMMLYPEYLDYKAQYFSKTPAKPTPDAPPDESQ